MSRNTREGSYCGRTSIAEAAQRKQVRSLRCQRNLPGTASANLEVLCRTIRQAQLPLTLNLDEQSEWTSNNTRQTGVFCAGEQRFI